MNCALTLNFQCIPLTKLSKRNLRPGFQPTRYILKKIYIRKSRKNSKREIRMFSPNNISKPGKFDLRGFSACQVFLAIFKDCN